MTGLEIRKLITENAIDPKASRKTARGDESRSGTVGAVAFSLAELADGAAAHGVKCKAAHAGLSLNNNFSMTGEPARQWVTEGVDFNKTPESIFA